MWSLLKKNIKVFLRAYNILIVTLIAFIGFVGYLFLEVYNFTIHHDTMWFLLVSHRVSVFVFIISIYISYEYMIKAKNNHLDECVSTYSNGSNKLYGGSFAVLLLMSISLFLIFLVFNYFIYFIGGINNLAYAFHILKANFINIFLVSMLASLVGTCIAFSCKRFAAYSIIALIVFLISPISEQIPAAIYLGYGVDIYSYRNFFSNILPSNLYYQPDFLYGVSIEAFRWNLVGFWVSVSGGVLLYRFRKKNYQSGRVPIVLLIICASFNLFGYMSGGSYINLALSPHSVYNHDLLYYFNVEKKEQVAQFDVIGYNMNLVINRQLEADIEITIDNPLYLEKYLFTLYRGYKVKNIYNAEGEALEFQRDGDYIDIYIKTPKAHDSIRIIYEGYSPMFYSNNQGVLLPGFFPFYPMSGHRTVCYTNDEQGIYNFVLTTDEKNKHFEVKIKSGLEIISNLSTTNEIHEGYSDTLSLVGGFVVKEQIANYEVFNLAIDDKNKHKKENTLLTLNDEITKYEKMLGESDHFDISRYKIIQAPETLMHRIGHGTGRGSILALKFSDHVFLGLGYDPKLIATELLSFNIPNNYDKYSGINILMQYLVSKDSFIENMDVLQEKFIEQIEILGEEYVLKQTYHFLKNTSDTRTFENFLAQLK